MLSLPASSSAMTSPQVWSRFSSLVMARAESAAASSPKATTGTRSTRARRAHGPCGALTEPSIRI